MKPLTQKLTYNYFLFFILIILFSACKKNITTTSGASKSVLDSVFTATAASGGIGGFDFSNTADKAIAFDYDHSGKMDYIVCYRPGYGGVAIEKNNNNGTFTTVWNSGSGIGGYDLSDGHDLIIAYDGDHSGKQDYLVAFRPGKGAVYVIKHVGTTNSPTAFQGQAFSGGIGGFDFSNSVDRMFTFDFEKSGKKDYLVAYRSGSNVVYIIKHVGVGLTGTYTPQFSSSSGIGGYNLVNG